MTDGLNFIGGTWVPAVSGQTFTRRNPADPTDVVGTFPASGPRDVATAIDHLDKAAPDWAATSPERRAAVLESAAAHLEAGSAQLIDELVREEGKTVAEATNQPTPVVKVVADAMRKKGAALNPQNLANELLDGLGLRDEES